MKKFNIAVMAAAVSFSLSLTAQATEVKHNFSSAVTLTANGSSHAIKTYNTNVQTRFAAAKNSARVANRVMANQYNEDLGVTSINWMSKSQITAAKPNQVLARKAQIEMAGKSYLTQVANKHGFVNNKASQATLKQVHDLGRGAIVAKYQQTVNGVEVFGSQINVVMNQGLAGVASTGHFAPVTAQTANKSANSHAVDAPTAIITSYAQKGVELSHSQLNFDTEQKQYQKFTIANEATTDVNRAVNAASNKTRAKFIYYPNNKSVTPAWMIEAPYYDAELETEQLVGYIIAADSGKVLFEQKMSADHAYKYNVYADDTIPYRPFDSPSAVETTPFPYGIDPTTLAFSRLKSNEIIIENAGLSTNDPWMPANAEFAEGNNAFVYADINTPEGFQQPEEGKLGDYKLDVSAPGSFNYQYNYNADLLDEKNVKAGLTQMFFTLNFLHDWFYDSGFDEAAGNAQKDNYGRGGLGLDPIEARIELSSQNNASMRTPADGESPLMRMYSWGKFEMQFRVNGLIEHTTDEQYHEYAEYGRAVFGKTSFDLPEIAEEGEEQGEAIIAIAQDNNGVSLDLCEEATNSAELAGKVAILQRGACSFAQKAENALDAGAIGYIVTNHLAAGERNLEGLTGGYLNMGLEPGADASHITIPGLFLSKENGQEIYDAISAGKTVKVVDTFIHTDREHSALDNHIVSHEWGHYVTNRLIFDGWGLFQWQSAALGEGWGDFVALMMALREEDRAQFGNEFLEGIYPITTYVGRTLMGMEGMGYGIRRFPYSTNLDVNPLTLGMVSNSAVLPIKTGPFYEVPPPPNEIHAAGEVWSVALWEVYIALHNERSDLTFDEVEKRMRDYFIASLKITPFWTNFLEARDAMLIVMAATDPTDFDIALRAFAKRGWGLDAKAPERSSYFFEGVREGFETQYPAFQVSNITADYQYVSETGAYCDADESLDVGETMQVYLHLTDYGTQPITGAKAIVNSITDLTVTVNGEATINNEVPVSFDGNFGEVKIFPFEITLNEAFDMSTIRLDISFDDGGADALVPSYGSAWISSQYDTAPHSRAIDNVEDIYASAHDWRIENEVQNGFGVGTVITPWLFDNYQASEALNVPQGQMWWGYANDVRALTAVVTPEVTVAEAGEFSVEFFHIFEFEQSEQLFGPTEAEAELVTENWDGGAVEISIDGGQWQDIMSVSGLDMTPTYNGVVLHKYSVEEAQHFNPLGGRAAFVGSTGVEGQQVKITVPDGVLNGKTVKLRFAVGTDDNTATLGWLLDDVEFSNIVNDKAFSTAIPELGDACVNRAPMFDFEQTPYFMEVSEKNEQGEQNTVVISAKAFDIDEDAAGNKEAVSYAWSQASGPSVSLTQATGEQMLFTVPVINRNETFEFMVKATDSFGNNKEHTIKLQVLDVNEAPTVTGSEISTTEGAKVQLTAFTEDLDNDALIYNWLQTGGDGVSFNGGKANTLTFIAPNITESTQLTFALTVSDGIDNATADYVVNVEPYKSNVDSGGGSLGWISLLTLMVLRLRSRSPNTVK
ncbi:M36 family metallopeptidase [Thalassotalea psychrophila]|uniref:M36 family metallopeptidase n=1 Tax=Thalassotalea psychrophila TaxID=3065647 RepID=A0ABY9TYP2_9GAMM|nr:M36 family metallopeptidase [Colwelliaceae bacterium SQ149]